MVKRAVAWLVVAVSIAGVLPLGPAAAQDRAEPAARPAVSERPTERRAQTADRDPRIRFYTPAPGPDERERLLMLMFLFGLEQAGRRGSTDADEPRR